MYLPIGSGNFYFNLGFLIIIKTIYKAVLNRFKEKYCNTQTAYIMKRFIFLYYYCAQRYDVFYYTLNIFFYRFFHDLTMNFYTLPSIIIFVKKYLHVLLMMLVQFVTYMKRQRKKRNLNYIFGIDQIR